MIVKLNFRANAQLGTMSFIVSFNDYDTIVDILGDPEYFRYCLRQLKTEMVIPDCYYLSGLEDLDFLENQIPEEGIQRNY